MRMISLSWFLAITVFLTSCWSFDKSDKSCYRIKNSEVYLRYYGGYPRAKEVLLKVEGADYQSFKYIEDSREGACQRGYMFAKDKKHVFYRNQKIQFASPETFVALSYGYSKDKNSVFYKELLLEKVDPESFFVIKNDRKHAYSADKYGMIIKNKRIGKQIDIHSFELLFKPYSKDKNNVYYTEEFNVLKGADPESFTCPEFKSIVNFQYYAFDKNNAYYYEKGKVSIIKGIDNASFMVLSTHYAKDKNKVYYKDSVMSNADAESFHVPDKINKRTAQDKNHHYYEGKVKKK